MNSTDTGYALAQADVGAVARGMAAAEFVTCALEDASLMRPDRWD
jgi:hypothetical protein